MMRKLAMIFAVVLVAAACGAESEVSDVAAAPDTTEVTTTTAAAPEEAAPEDDGHGEEGHAEGEEPHEDDGHGEEGHAEGEEPHEDDGHGEEGHAEEEEAHHDGARVIEIVMSDFDIQPETIEVSAGETIAFHITNKGAIEHEFRISNDHRIEEHVAAHEHGGHEESDEVDVIQEIPAGATAEVVLAFPEDVSIYSGLACLLPDHFEAGMHTMIEYNA